MATKNNLARITIDLPLDLQKKLKVIAALEGKSMREIVIEAIKEQIKLDDNGNIKFIKTL